MPVDKNTPGEGGVAGVPGVPGGAAAKGVGEETASAVTEESSRTAKAGAAAACLGSAPAVAP